jgi:hypothetical protein
VEPKVVKTISNKIYKQFPEVAGVQPKIRQQPGKGAAGTLRSTDPRPTTFLLTYHAVVSGPGGKSLPRWVRVTSDAGGRIIKISTSHGGK